MKIGAPIHSRICEKNKRKGEDNTCGEKCKGIISTAKTTPQPQRIKNPYDTDVKSGKSSKSSCVIA